MECTQFVELDDIATCDLNLFYYVTGWASDWVKHF
jgi:hypothetical protein